VRRAIYREGLDQWRNFAPWLEPLQSALGDALRSYRDDGQEHETGPQRSLSVR